MPLRLGLVRSLLGSRGLAHALDPALRRSSHLRGPRNRCGPEHRPDPGQPRVHGRHCRPADPGRLRAPGPDQRLDPELRLLGDRRRPELRMPLRLGLRSRPAPVPARPTRPRPQLSDGAHTLRGPRHRLGPEHRPDPGQPHLHGRHRRPTDPDRFRPPGPDFEQRPQLQPLFQRVQLELRVPSRWPRRRHRNLRRLHLIQVIHRSCRRLLHPSGPRDRPGSEHRPEPGGSRSFSIDTGAPAAPSLTDTDPDSPANDNNPEVKGSAEAGSTVKIYSTAGCTGYAARKRWQRCLQRGGITTPVAGDQTTSLRATATDSANNASGCSHALAYTEDSTAPTLQSPPDPRA